MEEATVLPTITKTFYKSLWPSINHSSANLPPLSMQWRINSLIDLLLPRCLRTTNRTGMSSSSCFRFQVWKMKTNSSSSSNSKTNMKMKTIRCSLNKITVLLSNSLLLSSASKEESMQSTIKWSMKIAHRLILKRSRPQPTSQLQTLEKNPPIETIGTSKWKMHRRKFQWFSRETRPRISSKRLLMGGRRDIKCNRLNWSIGRLRRKSRLTLKEDGSTSRRTITFRLRKRLISRGPRRAREWEHLVGYRRLRVHLYNRIHH